MTPELAAEEDSLDERATAILDEVDSHVTSLDGDDASREEALDALRQLGEQAYDLVSDSNPKALLEALDTTEDAETEYEELSLPAAMSKSDPESVIDLRSLLRLSKLPDADDDAFSEHVEELREMRPVSPDDSEETESDSESADTASPSESEDGDSVPESAESAESTETDESAESAESSSEQESGSAAESDSSGETDSDPSEKVKQELQGRLDDFREGVRSYRESLTEEEDDDGDSGDADSESGMASSSSPGRRTGTTFSTVPSRSRIGMTGTPRFSTMNPRKNRDSE